MATRFCLAHGVRRAIGYAPCHLLDDEFPKVSLADSSSGHLRTGTRLGGTYRAINRPNRHQRVVDFWRRGAAFRKLVDGNQPALMAAKGTQIVSGYAPVVYL